MHIKKRVIYQKKPHPNLYLSNEFTGSYLVKRFESIYLIKNI